MPDTTDVAAYLAGVRRNWKVFGEGSATPRLLAALEAVLELPGKWDTTAAELDEKANALPEGGNYTTTAARAVMLSTRAQAHADLATALREAISREPPGEGAGGGSA